MHRQHSPAFLNSVSIVGPFVTLRNFRKMAQKNRSAAVLFSDSLPTNQLSSFMGSTFPTAIILRKGSLIDHLAVLLNSKGSQLIIAPGMSIPPSHKFVLIDGIEEEIIFDNNEAYLRTLLARRINLRQNAKVLKSPPLSKHKPRAMSISIHVDGNRSEELSHGLKEGATGVGILRTDWLGWQDESPPTLQEHLRVYREAQNKVFPYQLNIRLFDIGGDKIPRWARTYRTLLRSPLGHRGIRAALLPSEAFSNQIAAISTLARDRPVGIVIPMVTDLSDIEYVREQINKHARNESRVNISIGAMVEVPSAALMIKELLSHVDFVRIGPGDLTQFTLARDRSSLQPFDFSGKTIHKAVLRLIQETAAACQERGKPLSMCLDLEPRNELLRELIQIGVNTFSVAPHSVKLMNKRIMEVLAPEE